MIETSRVFAAVLLLGLCAQPAAGEDFYAGMPVVTRNNFGKGQAWYVASSPDAAFLKDFTAYLTAEKGIKPLLKTPDGVEVTLQTGEKLRAVGHLADRARQGKVITMGMRQ